ncbi:MAG: site-2 protease family protein, partial [Candidatus Zixiibacteriota bacterium]
TLIRQTDTLTTTIITRKSEIMNAQGKIDTVGEIGISEKVMGWQKYGLFEAVANGFSTTHVIVWETLRFIKQLFLGEVSTKMIGGPLFIAQQSGKEARRGPSRLIFFMALLSVNLAVLNIQPIIPVLDGGQLLFLLIEKVRGVPLSMKARIAVQYFGLIAVISLTIFVTYNDIMRLLGRL